MFRIGNYVFFPKILSSAVPGHEGECVPIWINRNRFLHRQDGGVTMQCRLIKQPKLSHTKTVYPTQHGRCVVKLEKEPFHGIVHWDAMFVETTAIPENGD